MFKGIQNETHSFVPVKYKCFYVNNGINEKEANFVLQCKNSPQICIKLATPSLFIITIYINSSTVRTANMKTFVLSILAVIVLFISFDAGILGSQQLSENVPLDKGFDIFFSYNQILYITNNLFLSNLMM